MVLCEDIGLCFFFFICVMLDDFCLFLSYVVLEWYMFYFVDIGVWSGVFKFFVIMKRRYVRVSVSYVGLSKKEEIFCIFGGNLDFLEVIWMMVVCLIWMYGVFVFYNESDFVLGVDDLMVKLFVFLGFSYSFFDLNIMFYCFYYMYLFRLLGEFCFLEMFVLDVCFMFFLEYVESVV